MNKAKEKEIQKLTDKIFREEKRKQIKRNVIWLYACIAALVLIDLLTVVTMVRYKLDCDPKIDLGCNTGYVLSKMFLWVYTSTGVIVITVFGSIIVSRTQKMLKGIKFRASFRKTYQNALDIGLALFVILVIISFMITTTALMMQ